MPSPSTPQRSGNGRSNMLMPTRRQPGSPRVMDGDWTAGEGREAAQNHYSELHRADEDLVEVGKDVAQRPGRLSHNVHSAKRTIRKAHDDAHRDIERALMTNGGQPVGVGPIITPYRTLIGEISAQLLGYGHQEATGLTDKFGPPPEAPPAKGNDSGFGRDGSTPGEKDRPPSVDDGVPGKKGPHGLGWDSSTDANGEASPSTGAGDIGVAGPGYGRPVNTPGTSAPSGPHSPSSVSTVSPPSLGGGSGGGGGSPFCERFEQRRGVDAGHDWRYGQRAFWC